ncbi:uncharacterized protein FA14DRAFT_161952 [Meira miltonrushii]|uniref:Glycosyltransferase family 69 protein n=1 Tax=Meira miltonrushii TaxID=1280837 RepID=A0A316V8Q0_9BASI|nr:uncharacterized protein FA14DRAFT_161952 [Meira miltonrushii]PWN32573.1 hypothetical protein FA14DRAFT_161952 [Meira miltonrushii]
MDDHIHDMSYSNSSAGSSASSSSGHGCYSDSIHSENVEYFALKIQKEDHRNSSDDEDNLSVLAFTEDDVRSRSRSRFRPSCANWQRWCMFGAFIASTSILCWAFHCPSTMFVYLAWLFIIIPVEAASFARSLLSRNRIISLDFDQYNIKRTKPTYFSLVSKRLRIALLMLGCCIWSWAIVESMIGPYPTPQTSESIGPTFIAANLYNSNNLFPKYGDDLIKLVESIGGPQNAYISIFESNSEDGTEKSLDRLSHKLQTHNIPHTIISGNNATKSIPTDHVGITDDGNRRIAFLANVRNEAMRPLYENTTSLKFEKVLWLNDVIFDSDEIKELLQTNGGMYDEACAFDFMPLGLYDTWVTRDIDGNRAKPLWPYFAADRDVKTLEEQKPILVDSCWNGAVAFDARWFRDSTAPLTKPDKHHLTKREQDSAAKMPLRFRNSNICLSSECLLTSLDIHQALQPIRPVIVMNPKVVTAYDRKTFYLYHNIMRWHVTQPWRLVWERFVSAYLFQSLTDMGRKPAQCFEAFQSLWTTPHPLAQKAKTNTEVLKDVLAKRWQ